MGWIGWVFAVYVLIGATTIDFSFTEKWVKRLAVIVLWLPYVIFVFAALKSDGWEWNWDWLPGKRKD